MRQAKGFKEAAVAMTGEALAADYRRESEGAPLRPESGKKFLVSHNTKLAASRRVGRDGEHVAIALVQWAQENGALPMPDDEGTFEPLHAGVVLKSAQADKALGADDPNWGVDRVDLAGIGPDDRLALAMMRFLAPEVTRVGTGDTPLRALLEGLAHSAIAEANREVLVAELATRSERPISDGPPRLFLLGSARYWELCRKREAQKGAAWIREMERLAREIEAECGVSIHYLTVRVQGEPGWGYETGAPAFAAIPRLIPAWEPGAGRLRPKPRPKKRRDTIAPADVLVEGDLTRPIRPYAISDLYSAGDRIEHPTLGTGVVQGGVGPHKIRVLFDGRRSLLVHARQTAGPG